MLPTPLVQSKKRLASSSVLGALSGAPSLTKKPGRRLCSPDAASRPADDRRPSRRERPRRAGMVLNRDCQHYGVVSFETIGPPSGFTFIDLPKTRRFVAGNAAPVRCRSCRTGRRIGLPARLRQACGRWTSATFPCGAASCIWRRQSTCPVGGCWRIVFRERKINVQ